MRLESDHLREEIRNRARFEREILRVKEEDILSSLHSYDRIRVETIDEEIRLSHTSRDSRPSHVSRETKAVTENTESEKLDEPSLIRFFEHIEETAPVREFEQIFEVAEKEHVIEEIHEHAEENVVDDVSFEIAVRLHNLFIYQLIWFSPALIDPFQSHRYPRWWNR